MDKVLAIITWIKTHKKTAITIGAALVAAATEVCNALGIPVPGFITQGWDIIKTILGFIAGDPSTAVSN